MSLIKLRILLCSVPLGWIINVSGITLNGQPACIISGGSEIICSGTSTIWSGPDGMTTYLWTGPSGFTAVTRDVTISIPGDYNLSVTDLNGTNNCSRHLSAYPELSPGSINTTPRQFCTGGTTAIGGTSSPYGPAIGGSGSYLYVWQSQLNCTGTWVDIPESNTTSYTPVAPPVTTCYRRKVTDLICGNETFTDSKKFEIFEDPVSQTIIPNPSNQTPVCAGTPVSATFAGGSGGFPGGTSDTYEYSINGGSSWSTYTPSQNIPTSGVTGTNVIQIRTRRISTGVNGCNYGSYVSVSWSFNSIPVTSSIYHR